MIFLQVSSLRNLVSTPSADPEMAHRALLHQLSSVWGRAGWLADWFSFNLSPFGSEGPGPHQSAVGNFNLCHGGTGG